MIPQKGRLDLLEQTLRSIATQKLAPGPVVRTVQLEVILVTQDAHPGAVRRLMEEILDGPDHLSFRCIEERDAETISVLRNLGARAAAGEVLAFLDSDIRLSESWTRVLLEELLCNERRVVVSAVQVGADDLAVVERIQSELSRMKADADVGFLSGHNLMTHRRVFDATGGFPEHLQTCEDYVFADRANALGSLYLTSRASYVHLGEDRDYGIVFRKEQWRARSNLASIAGRRVGLAELPSFTVPLVVTGALVVLPVALLSGNITLFVAALLIGALPLFAYTVRLLLASGGRLGLFEIFGYYLAYFPARGLGLLRGAGDLLRFAQRS